MSPAKEQRGASFDQLTAIEEVDGGIRAWISESASGFSGAHGGYLGALVLRGLRQLVGDASRVPRALSLQLLAPVGPGGIDIERRLDRHGRSVTAVSARLGREGDAQVLALGVFGRSSAGIARNDARMPSVATPQQCRPLHDKPVAAAKAGLLVEHRPAGPLPLTGRDHAEILVWMRLVEERPLDELALTFLADSIPPAVYVTLTEFVPMPSLGINLQFEPVGLPPKERWVLGVARNRVAAGGYLVEDGELWSTEGQLLVHSRQLRRVFTGADTEHTRAAS